MGYKDTSSQFGRLKGMELGSGGIDLEKKKIVLTKLSRRTKVLAYGVADFFVCFPLYVCPTPPT